MNFGVDGGRFDGLGYFFVFGIVFTMFIFRLIAFLFFLFRFALNLSQGVSIVSVKMFMMEVALLTVLTDFVEVVHVQLNQNINTCLTKDE